MLTEDRTNGRLKRCDIRHHHYNFAGRKRCSCEPFSEQPQQLIVQNFHFALRVVRDVEHDGPVRGG